jgi:modulator of FtsH protease
MIAGWDDFFTAQVGASAALAGLIFVGVSINMPKIISSTILPDRALQALLVLFVILVASSVLLIPGQSLLALGSEILVIGLVTCATNTLLSSRVMHRVEQKYRRSYWTDIVFGQFATIPYVVSGLYMIVAGADGLYILALAIILSFAKGITDAWVLLVEINR